MEDQVRYFIICFTSILYEALPFIVLGAVISGILEELVPQELIAKLVPRNRPLAIAMSCLLGVLFPIIRAVCTAACTADGFTLERSVAREIIKGDNSMITVSRPM